jgi:hypothetical protein
LEQAVAGEGMIWTDDPRIFLRQELRDLLDADPVGLYELVWLPRGGFPGMVDEEIFVVATEVANAELATGVLVLRRLRWPLSLGIVHDIVRTIIEPDDFDLGEEFVALDRVAHGDPTTHSPN